MLSIVTTFTAVTVAMMVIQGDTSKVGRPTVNSMNHRGRHEATATVAVCSTAVNCSLNGDCINGMCECDPPWNGTLCDTLNVKPVAFPQGYGMNPTIQANINTSWGGSIVYDGGKYHMFVNTIVNECQLSAWFHNSRIDHGISDVITGPYTFRDTALNTFASNPAVVVLKNAPYTYAMFHIGNGTNGGHQPENCTTASPKSPNGEVHPAWYDSPPKSTSDTTQLDNSNAISVANSLNGPWVALPNNTLPPCNNPAPWVHPNGTLFALCDDAFIRADAITGPWTPVGRSIPHSSGPVGWHYEDPFLYSTKRGFHILYHASNNHENPPLGLNCHNSTVSAHVYSSDGYTWHTSHAQPYGNHIEVNTVPSSNGVDQTRTSPSSVLSSSSSSVSTQTVIVATRERPKLWFNADGEITHLVNGVCGASSCTDSPKTGCMDCKYKHWDYTLVQPLGL
eukprot:m.106302 g.106302  ORF g.106302 m.106302 type:complete len:451 (-) comp27712_c0_seq3:113-1465(-)